MLQISSHLTVWGNDWVKLVGKCYTGLQYSCLENPVDGRAWKAAVHGVTEGWTRLSDFTFTFHFHALEKEMATPSSTLAWRILWREEPGRLQSMRSQRVRHDWATSLQLMRPDNMMFVFWMLSFKPAFSLSSFTLIEKLFSSSSLSAIRVVSSAYLRLWIFFPAILIPTCDSSSPAFHMMYSAYKLNKRDDNIQPRHTPFPILNQSIIPCLIPTVASWPAYRFLRRQVRWSGIPISLRISPVCCDLCNQRL